MNHRCYFFMPRSQVQRKQSDSSKTKSDKNFDAHEFYLLEKLYEAMRKDKKRGKMSSTDREFYLMERLYEAMRKDKIKNKKLSSN